MSKNEVFWGSNPFRSILGSFNRNLSFLRSKNSNSIPHEVLPLGQAGFVFSKRKEAGFTIIELVTVIGVLAILAAIIMAVVNPLEQFNKAADTRRKSDLAQIQKALEVYYQDYGRYPYRCTTTINNIQVSQISKSATCNATNIITWGEDFRPYIDILPIEQKRAKTYGYYVDSTGQSYALYASLDRGSKDPQSCSQGVACTNAAANNIRCGGICNYGVSSPNIAP